VRKVMGYLQFNVIGKKGGQIVSMKRGVRKEAAANSIKSEWERNGVSVIVDDERKQIMLDDVVVEPVEVLWSR